MARRRGERGRGGDVLNVGATFSVEGGVDHRLSSVKAARAALNRNLEGQSQPAFRKGATQSGNTTPFPRHAVCSRRRKLAPAATTSRAWRRRGEHTFVIYDISAAHLRRRWAAATAEASYGPHLFSDGGANVSQSCEASVRRAQFRLVRSLTRPCPSAPRCASCIPVLSLHVRHSVFVHSTLWRPWRTSSDSRQGSLICQKNESRRMRGGLERNVRRNASIFCPGDVEDRTNAASHSVPDTGAICR